MEVLNQTPFVLLPLVTQPEPTRHQLTLIAKATFQIVPSAPASLADEQLPIAGDTPFDDGTSLRIAGDLVPFKPRADVLLVGHCCTPGGRALPECQVTLQMGALQKSIRVVGDREWQVERGEMTAPVPFARMPLRFERAWGGSGDRHNPAGRGVSPVRDDSGRPTWPMPNLEDPIRPLQTPNDRYSALGFGPISPDWNARLRCAGTYDARWQQTRWPYPPEDFDPAFFNAAPFDQQVDGYLRGDESVLLENLHPQHPRLQFQLPGQRLRSYVVTVRPDEQGQEVKRFEPVRMQLDTLWIDADALTLTLTWRGICPIQTPDGSEVQAWYSATEPTQEAPLTDAEYYALFKEARHQQAKSEAIMTAEEAREKNAELRASYGPDAPGFPEDLEGKPAPEQTKLLLAAVAEIEKYSQQHTETKLASSGVDPQQLAKQQKQAKAQPLRALGKHKDAWQTIDELDKQGLPTHQARAELHAQGLGPGATCDAIPMTRELLLEKVAAGETVFGADLSGLDLSRCDLRAAKLSQCYFADSSLEKADLTDAVLEGSVFSNANLTQACLAGANCAKAIFDGAVMSAVNLSAANLTQASLTGADLRSAMMIGVHAEKAIFHQANLEQANMLQGVFSGAEFFDAQLPNAICREADFLKANFQGAQGANANFTAARLDAARFGDGSAFPQAIFHQCCAGESIWRQVDLTGSDFSYAEMPKSFWLECNLAEAQLNATVLRQAKMMGSQLPGANLDDADLMEVDFQGADLSRATLRGANAFGANFLEAKLQECDTHGVNGTNSLLAKRSLVH